MNYLGSLVGPSENQAPLFLPASFHNPWSKYRGRLNTIVNLLLNHNSAQALHPAEQGRAHSRTCPHSLEKIHLSIAKVN
jgi:hypothetical protein